MFEQVLLPVDDSDAAAAAFDNVLDLAELHDATVHLLHVADSTIESLVQLPNDTIEVLEREGELLVQGFAEQAGDRNVSVVIKVLTGEPDDRIVDYAESQGIDLIVMPRRGRSGLDRIFLGSVTKRVVRTASVPVLTFPPVGSHSSKPPYEKLLVPVDGSPCAERALEQAIEWTSGAGSALYLLHVVETASLGIDVYSLIEEGALAEAGTTILEDAQEAVEAAGIDTVSHSIEYGSVPKEVLTHIDEQDIDLVVLGTHGRSGIERYLLGSVAEKVVRSAPVPVLTVP